MFFELIIIMVVLNSRLGKLFADLLFLLMRQIGL